MSDVVVELRAKGDMFNEYKVRWETPAWGSDKTGEVRHGNNTLACSLLDPSTQEMDNE